MLESVVDCGADVLSSDSIAISNPRESVRSAPLDVECPKDGERLREPEHHSHAVGIGDDGRYEIVVVVNVPGKDASIPWRRGFVVAWVEAHIPLEFEAIET